jgi:hypothetical protein
LCQTGTEQSVNDETKHYVSPFFSHFCFSGATVSVETEYSPVMSRQYLNVNFIPTAMFSKNTEGLCGFMDDDDTNDLIGPNGEQYNNDTLQFAESCE